MKKFRQPNNPVGAGRRRQAEQGLENNGREIITPSEFSVNLFSPHTTAPATPPATAKQVRYLQDLRRSIGLPRWNALKAFLEIETSGTHGLTRREADRLIKHIRMVLGG